MKILVTGATGFIGKHLVDHLADLEHDVVCVVRRTSNIRELKRKGIPLVVANLRDEAGVNKVFDKVQPDVVFHCAAKVTGKNEKEFHRVNVESTRNICDACYSHGVKRLIYLSSVAVISGNPDVPLRDDLPYEASDPYGRSKIAAEQVVMAYRRKGLPVAILRPCIVYGEDESHAMDKILRSVKSRRMPIVDLPEMDSKLNLVYVGNVIQALSLALEKDEALEGTFIIADREIITLKRFVEIAYDELGKGSPPVIPEWMVKYLMIIPSLRKKAERLFKDRIYNIGRAVDLLGYDPKVATEEGLRKTIRYWKENKA